MDGELAHGAVGRDVDGDAKERAEMSDGGVVWYIVVWYIGSIWGCGI